MSRVLLPLERGPHRIEETAEARLLHRLRRLPRRAQQVLLLSRLDQLGFASIAQRLGLPLSCVEYLMNQALLSACVADDALLKEACRWYVRLQSPDVTACERIDFRRWLDARPGHLAAFRETELRWRGLLEPARQLGHDGWYRQGRAALSLGGCAIAVGLGIAALLTLGYWA
ncbi:FecR/PupR family sigma factor regulator [Pseudomonas sp. Marseille-QA0332]